MKKLYRSQRDKKLFGLCGGLAEMLNVDATLLRLVVVVTTFFSGGAVIFLYIVASLVIPKEPAFGMPGYPPGFADFGGGHHQGGMGGMHGHSGPYPNAGTGNGAYYAGASAPGPRPEQTKSEIDEMMKDIEKKALWKEIEELKQKLSKYEKGDV